MRTWKTSELGLRSIGGCCVNIIILYNKSISLSKVWSTHFFYQMSQTFVYVKYFLWHLNIWTSQLDFLFLTKFSDGWCSLLLHLKKIILSEVHFSVFSTVGKSYVNLKTQYRWIIKLDWKISRNSFKNVGTVFIPFKSLKFNFGPVKISTINLF